MSHMKAGKFDFQTIEPPNRVWWQNKNTRLFQVQYKQGGAQKWEWSINKQNTQLIQQSFFPGKGCF